MEIRIWVRLVMLVIFLVSGYGYAYTLALSDGTFRDHPLERPVDKAHFVLGTLYSISLLYWVIALPYVEDEEPFRGVKICLFNLMVLVIVALQVASLTIPGTERSMHLDIATFFIIIVLFFLSLAATMELCSTRESNRPPSSQILTEFGESLEEG